MCLASTQLVTAACDSSVSSLTATSVPSLAFLRAPIVEPVSHRSGGGRTLCGPDDRATSSMVFQMQAIYPHPYRSLTPKDRRSTHKGLAFQTSEDGVSPQEKVWPPRGATCHLHACITHSCSSLPISTLCSEHYAITTCRQEFAVLSACSTSINYSHRAMVTLVLDLRI